MSPITLSAEALALLRRRLTQGDRRVDDSNGCDRAGARDYAAFLGFFFLEPS